MKGDGLVSTVIIQDRISQPFDRQTFQAGQTHKDGQFKKGWEMRS